MKYLILIFALLISSYTQASSDILNLYAWSAYLPSEVAEQFEKETGVHINYTTYDTNETMYAKLKADPFAGYDLIVPSSYFIDRLRRQGMIQKIDRSKVANLNNLNPDLLNKDFDPHNAYSIPYLWGSTAIVVNDKYFLPANITSWADFWKPQYKDQLLVLDDTREIFAIALLVLGYSPNDTDPEHIKLAYFKLKQLLPNIKLFNTEAMLSIYIDEDVTLGMGWSGAIYNAARQNPHLKYIYPKEGYSIWIDSMAIPTHAQHLENVYKFINFILRPDVAKKLSMSLGFASPNIAAVKLMPPKCKTIKLFILTMLPYNALSCRRMSVPL